MRVPPKPILLIAAGAVGLLVLVCVAALLFVDVNRYKPQLEAAATKVLGMDVRFTGRLSLGFLPSLHVSADGGQVLDDRGAEVASARRARLSIRVLPLLLGKVHLRTVDISEPRLSIERDAHGGTNVDSLTNVTDLLRTMNGASVRLRDGTFTYVDRQTGSQVEARGFDLSLSHVRLGERDEPELLRRLSLNGAFTCREIRSRKFAVSDVKASVRGRHGVFEVDPVTMRIFGGKEVGNLHADFTGPVPSYRLKCSLPAFHVDAFLQTLSPQKAAEGTMDFSASLSMRGGSLSPLVRTLTGEMSLRGANIRLDGIDLDRVISRFESSQNFKLVDVGAVFLAGPLGLAVTRGYDFGTLFRGAGGTTNVRSLVSTWSVERGVAQAQDVAMATDDNRLALRGGLDFVNAAFGDVTVAVVNGNGCARVKQVIHGPFAKPIVEKPSLLGSMTGPVVNLVKKARRVLPSAPCEPFYSGSVAAPK
jgi:AsmA protein